ncbi:Lipoprotein-releasing system transmembrane protein LolE [uncultured bacterium]|nr:Lipoprotein-releasing system transmembrane protein LolE [uncultured bacterium]
MYLRLAFRNIFRNKVRSLITLGAISFGCISLIIAGGFIENTFIQLRESYIRSFLGHIQVYKKGFLEQGVARPFDFMISNPDEVIKKITDHPHVVAATPRLEFSGLLSTGETTVSFIGQGVNPKWENQISTFVQLEKGENLAEGDTYKTILGKGLSEALMAKAGDPLVLVANTKSGAINALDMEVKGVFFTSSKAYDDRALRVPVEVAQKLLHTDDIQTIVVLLDDTSETDAVIAGLNERFKKDGLDLEVKPWYDMADFYTKTVDLYKRQFFVLKLIIGIVVVLSVFNTMNMAILERIGEVGTIMALGTKRRGVVTLFLLEGLILGIVGGVIGVASGYLLAMLISYIGIPMPPPPGATIYWTAQIEMVPAIFAFAFVLAIVTSVVSSCYPAIKASRLEIAEALRHNI